MKLQSSSWSNKEK